jgi:hypothetical protein
MRPKLPLIRVETLGPVEDYKPHQLYRAVQIATVYRIGVFVLCAPPEHA